MKIGIDISQIVYKTGVSLYTKNLVENLLKIDRSNKYLLFGGSLRQRNALKQYTLDFKGNLVSKIYPISPLVADFLWNRLHLLPMETFLGALDVFHSSDWTQPPSRAFKVTTIHDLTPLIFKNEANPGVVAAHERRLSWVKKEADRVVAVSQSTKNDIIKYLGIPENKIKVIYEASDPVFYKRSEKEIERVKRKYAIKEDYLLTVGRGRRKNLENIYKAYQKSSSLKEMSLVVACYGELNVQKGMIHAKDSTSEELACLYSGAKCLVYPSFYEGFGLPILDAFACHCPVVTSNVSSMPEVAGEAAILVEPHSVDDIKKGIEKALKEAESLIDKGRKRVESFSWEKTARETLKVYQEAV